MDRLEMCGDDILLKLDKVNVKYLMELTCFQVSSPGLREKQAVWGQPSASRLLHLPLCLLALRKSRDFSEPSCRALSTGQAQKREPGNSNTTALAWWPSLNSPQFDKVLSVPFSCWGSLKLYTQFSCSTYRSYLFPPYPSVNNLADLLLSSQHHSEEMTEMVMFLLHKWPSIHIPEVYHIKVDITIACLTNFQYFQWKSRQRRAEFSSLNICVKSLSCFQEKANTKHFKNHSKSSTPHVLIYIYIFFLQGIIIYIRHLECYLKILLKSISLLLV